MKKKLKKNRGKIWEKIEKNSGTTLEKNQEKKLGKMMKKEIRKKLGKVIRKVAKKKKIGKKQEINRFLYV